MGVLGIEGLIFLEKFYVINVFWVIQILNYEKFKIYFFNKQIKF